MKVAVTSQGPDLESPVDPRFGRAKYLLIVDTDTGQFTAHDNTQNLNTPQGAGIQVAQTVSNLGVEVVLTGNVGPKAFTTLQVGRIDVCTGASGTARDAIEDFKSGRLQPVTKPNVAGHWG
jgi:predicted Fe-Mo cluster-binding NifX family protein